MVQPLPRLTPATRDVLDALLGATEPLWGLRLVRLTTRPAGSIYPILARLERIGWVASAWEDTDRPGPRRRLYALTGDGAAAARARLAAVAPPAPPRRPGIVDSPLGGTA